MNSIRTIKKNAKALSPVVASIILIAVTVAVSVAVAAWMGGMTVGLMGGTEKVSITNLGFDGSIADANTITATVQNVGDGAVTINGAFIDGTSVVIPSAPVTIAKGVSADFVLPCEADLVDGQLYQVKLSTTKGNTVVYTATYNAPV